MLYNKFKEIKKVGILKILLLCIPLLLLPNISEAASLYLRPSTQSISVGNILQLKLVVNTDGKTINSSGGTIQFPTDIFDVVSVSKSSSIFSLWVEDPKFSNYEGTVNFEGGLPNPGYAGSAGEILSVTLRAKKEGNASLLISDASVRENDGLGTDILSSRSSATIQVVGVSKDEVTTPVESKPEESVKNLVPIKPIITSSTHPKQDIWYTSTKASFSWAVPDSVTSVQASLNKTSMLVPTVTYDSSVSQKTLKDVDSGIQYFNLRFKNGAGWGPVAHYKVMIDGEAPEEFTADIQEREGRNVLRLNAVDKVSGVDYYMLEVDSNEPIKVSSSDIVDNEYVLPVLDEGHHSIKITVFDKAGNKRLVEGDFISPHVMPPEIQVTPSKIEQGESIKVTGLTEYPNSKVLIQIQIGDDEITKIEKETDSEGKFNLDYQDVKTKGTLKVWANMVLGANQIGDISEIKYVTVGNTKLVQNLINITYPTVSVIIYVIAGLILLMVLYVGWHRFFGLRKRLKGDLNETIESVHKTMTMLKKELNSQLKILKKTKEDRVLNEKEESIFEALEENVENIEKIIEKKIKKLM